MIIEFIKSEIDNNTNVYRLFKLCNRLIMNLHFGKINRASSEYMCNNETVTRRKVY